MNDLEIFDIYENANKEKSQKFVDEVDSSLRIKIDTKREIYFGMFSGALISILGLYLLCLDVKKIVVTQQGSYKRGILGYIQRYALYGVYLGVMAKFFGLSMIICSGLGLLSVKVNILLMALSDKIIKVRDKNLK